MRSTIQPLAQRADRTSPTEGAATAPALKWFLLLALLVGVFLRWSALRPMNDMLHYDEAYNGIDAMSLLQHPRLTPFFPGNFGREAGWMYYLLPFVAVFGAQPLGLRLAATIVGVLTLAAVQRLGTELLPKRAAAWATATMAVFYWPMHLSHLALRANLLPLVGSLAFAALLRARRVDKVAPWLVAGALTGLLMYTYYSARLWILYALLLLGWWVISSPQKRQGALLALLLAAILCVPMLVYSYAHPQESTNRIEMVGTLGLAEMRANVGLWTRAWFQHGDPNAEFNLPERPILDPALGILFLTGLAALLLNAEMRRSGLLILGLALSSVLPSLLSNQSPHFLRAIGLTVPIALVSAWGAWSIEAAVRRKWNARLAPLLPLALIVITGMVSYRDFHVRWLQHPEVPILAEQHINQAINFMREQVPPETPVYFSPFVVSHPVLAFRESDLAPREVGAFDSHYCMAVPDQSAAYFSLTLYEPMFEQDLSRWAALIVLHQEPVRSEDRTLYTVFQATTRPDFLRQGPAAVFGNALRMALLVPITTTCQAGEAVPITLGLKALHPLGRDYSVFVHLYGDPTPYEGGVIWAQGDSQACATYPSRLWRTDETIVQDFWLQLPHDLPPAEYAVAVGIYESPAGDRLPITWPEPQPNDFLELQRIEVRGQ